MLFFLHVQSRFHIVSCYTQSVLCSKPYTLELVMDNGTELEDLLLDDPDPHSGDPVNSLREIESLPFKALTLVVN